jgi:hypothetical protein
MCVCVFGVHGQSSHPNTFPPPALTLTHTHAHHARISTQVIGTVSALPEGKFGVDGTTYEVQTLKLEMLSLAASGIVTRNNEQPHLFFVFPLSSVV